MKPYFRVSQITQTNHILGRATTVVNQTNEQTMSNNENTSTEKKRTEKLVNGEYKGEYKAAA